MPKHYNRRMDRPDHHYHPLVRNVARALRQRCHVVPGSAIVVACSGGGDSVALLRVLAMLAERRKWRLRLIVGHVQHHLRDEAEQDAEFVERLAGELGLAYVRKDVRPGELSGNVEANARRLRYQALGEIAQQHDARFVATAHHAEDQLETLLMRMMRGSGVAGLRGIAWWKGEVVKPAGTVQVIRPMLGLSQEDITALLDRLDQPCREDATNFDTDRTRARLRHEVLPVLKELQSDAPQKANELTEHFSDLSEVLRQGVWRELKCITQTRDAMTMPRAEARRMIRAVLAELLRSTLIEMGAPPGRVTRNALMPAVAAAKDSAGGTRTFTFANGVTLTVTRDEVAIHR